MFFIIVNSSKKGSSRHSGPHQQLGYDNDQSDGNHSEVKQLDACLLGGYNIIWLFNDLITIMYDLTALPLRAQICAQIFHEHHSSFNNFSIFCPLTTFDS